MFVVSVDSHHVQLTPQHCSPENTKRPVVPLSICQLSESPLPDSHMVDQSFPTSPPNVEEPLVPEVSSAERLDVVHVAFSARAPSIP